MAILTASMIEQGLREHQKRQEILADVWWESFEEQAKQAMYDDIPKRQAIGRAASLGIDESALEQIRREQLVQRRFRWRERQIMTIRCHMCQKPKFAGFFSPEQKARKYPVCMECRNRQTREAHAKYRGLRSEAGKVAK